jgi:tRNA(Ile)-lysidine synthase
MTLLSRFDKALILRFRADFEALSGGAPGRIGVAVSGGADSMALLLLAAAAFPGELEAATVDHGLRVGGDQEAQQVAGLCARIGVRHAALTLAWTPPESNVQAQAREARYRALADWAAERGISWIATGHHLDDQAETMLLRLARGAGLSGLAGARAVRRVGSGVQLARPLLTWTREELAAIVEAAGVTPILDPSNESERFDRTRMRALLKENEWIAPARLAASAHHLGEAEEALGWAAAGLFEDRVERREDGSLALDPHGMPRELLRRLVVACIADLAPDGDLPGPKVMRLIDALAQGESATLAGVLVRPGERWRFAPAPPRRDRDR